jgi:hypothetical protein
MQFFLPASSLLRKAKPSSIISLKDFGERRNGRNFRATAQNCRDDRRSPDDDSHRHLNGALGQLPT